MLQMSFCSKNVLYRKKPHSLKSLIQLAPSNGLLEPKTVTSQMTSWRGDHQTARVPYKAPDDKNNVEMTQL